MNGNGYVGIGADERSIGRYREVVAALDENREHIISETRRYPLCVEMESIKLYTCLSNEADLNRLRGKLAAEIDRYERGDRELRRSWAFRLLGL